MKYNPKVTYNWPADAQITLTGKEFETLYNNLKSFINSKGEISNILKVADAFGVLHSKFAQLVENDIIKETPVTKSSEYWKEANEISGINPEWFKEFSLGEKRPLIPQNIPPSLDSNLKAFVGEKQ